MTRTPRTRLALDARRASLLAAAAELFEQRSFDEVSVEDVATAAGVSKGLLYHYFPGKRQLYLALVERDAVQMLEAIAAQVAALGEDAADENKRLRAALTGWMLFVRARPRAYEAVHRGSLSADSDVRQVADDVRSHMAELLRELLDRPAGPLTDIVIDGWIGFVESATLAWIDGGARATVEEVVDQCSQVLAALR